MNIAVLIKQIPRTTNVTLNNDYTLHRSNCDLDINPYDLHAVEEALRIREKTGGKVYVISLGTKNAEKVLRYALSLGADEGILISDNNFKGSDSFATAHILSRVVSQIDNCSVVICGKQSTDGSTAQVPVSMAAILDWNCATNVNQCDSYEDFIMCTSEYEHGNAVKRLNYPAIFSVNKSINTPRLPSVDGIISSELACVKVINNDLLKISGDLCGINGSLTKVIRTENTLKDNNRKLETVEKEKFHNILLKCIKESEGNERCNDKLDVVGSKETKAEKIAVFCEVRDGRICEESLNIIEQAYYLSKKISAEIVTISTKLNNTQKNLYELSKRGTSIHYMIPLEDVYISDVCVMGELIIKLLDKISPQIVLLAGTVKGRELAPYIAAKSKSGLTADCTELDITDGKLIQTRPAFGGKLNAVIISQNSRYEMATVKPNVFVNKYDAEPVNTKLIVEEPYEFFEQTENQFQFVQKIKLNENVVFGIGKGIGSKKNVDIIAEFCKKKAYGICATREVVDKGWLSFEYQVGLTGKVINPDVYVALGISGSNEHMVGVNNSKNIIAINSDSEAPVCKSGDYIINMQIQEFIEMIMED